VASRLNPEVHNSHLVVVASTEGGWTIKSWCAGYTQVRGCWASASGIKQLEEDG
jgi:hypothetical protein